MVVLGPEISSFGEVEKVGDVLVRLFGLQTCTRAVVAVLVHKWRGTAVHELVVGVVGFVEVGHFAAHLSIAHKHVAVFWMCFEQQLVQLGMVEPRMVYDDRVILVLQILSVLCGQPEVFLDIHLSQLRLVTLSDTVFGCPDVVAEVA